jgi:hypothetical protein
VRTVLPQVLVDPLVERLAEPEKEQRTVQSLLSRLNRHTVTVSCASIASQSRESETRRLRLLPDADPNTRLEPGSTKITPDDLVQVIANHEEVVAALSDTAYEHFLGQAVNRGNYAHPSD